MSIIGLYGLVPRTAAAAEPMVTIAVVVDGPGAGAVREALIKALPEGIGVADSQQFRRELARAGQTTPFGTFDKKAFSRLRRAARALGAEAVVVARVSRDKKSRLVRILVVDVVADVPPALSVPLSLKPSDSDSSDIATALGHALDAYSPRPKEPEAEPGPAPEAERAAAPTVPALPDLTGPPASPEVLTPLPPPRRTPAQLLATSLIDIALGAEASGRHFAYDNGIAPSTYVYRLPASPASRLSGSLFPFAALGGPLGDLGIAFDYSQMFLSKDVYDGARRGRPPASYSLGLRARIHPGLAAGKPRVILGASVGYAFASFGTVGPANAELPSVAYRALRPSLDARVPFGSFSLLGAFAFRAILNPASVSVGFYGAAGYGFDGELGAAFMFARHFEARLAARYERYSFDLTPSPSAPVRAGGAADQWYSARASLALVF